LFVVCNGFEQELSRSYLIGDVKIGDGSGAFVEKARHFHPWHVHLAPYRDAKRSLIDEG
jgi:hypothetical protein